MEKLFSNQTAIISGALGDIGRAIALSLAKNGANIGLGDIQEPEKAKDFLEQLQARGVKALYQEVDTADAGGVENWVAKIEKKLGIPSLIIPNAAIVTLKTLEEISAEEWEREINVNLNGAFYLSRACACRLRKNKTAGRIVFIGSWAAHRAHVHIPAYCVAKAGLRMLCKGLALDFAEFDILVNEVAPGYVDAGLTGKIFEDNPGKREIALAKVPIKRLIEPDEVALQVLHLCHPLNKQMTGSCILMDGGLSLL